MKRLICTAATLLAAVAMAATAHAGNVALKAAPMDDDGAITLGDLFEGAGSAAGVVVARRTGGTAVLDAAQVQIAARRAGLDWTNSTGLRRIVVRQGASNSAPQANSITAATRAGATVEALTYARNIAAGEVVMPEDVVWSTVQAHMAAAGSPQDAEQVIGLSARRPLRAGQAVNGRDLASPQVIARNDMVEVTYQTGGIDLTLTGRAQRNATMGEAVTILNLQSGRLIEAVAVAPGRALAGPAALAARHERASSNLIASR